MIRRSALCFTTALTSPLITVIATGLLLAAPVRAQGDEEALLSRYVAALQASLPPGEMTLEVGAIEGGTLRSLALVTVDEFVLTAESAQFEDIITDEGGAIQSVGTLHLRGVSLSSLDEDDPVTVTLADVRLADFALGTIVQPHGEGLRIDPSFDPAQFYLDPGSLLSGLFVDALAVDVPSLNEPASGTLDRLALRMDDDLIDLEMDRFLMAVSFEEVEMAIGMGRFVMDDLDLAGAVATLGEGLEAVPRSYALSDFNVSFLTPDSSRPSRIVFENTQLTRQGTLEEGRFDSDMTGFRAEIAQEMVPADVAETFGQPLADLLEEGAYVITGEAIYNASWSQADQRLVAEEISMVLDPLLALEMDFTFDGIDPVIGYRAVNGGATTSYEEEQAMLDMTLTRIAFSLENRGLVEIAQSHPMFLMAQGMGGASLMQFGVQSTDPRVKKMVDDLVAWLQDPQVLRLEVAGGPEATPRQIGQRMEAQDDPSNGLGVILDMLDVTLTVNP